MRRILKYVLKYKSILFFGSIAMFIIIGLDLLVPYMQKILVDTGLIGENYSVIVPIIIGFLSISLVKSLLGYVKEYTYDLVGTKVHQDIKLQMFDKIQSFEFEYFGTVNTGELMSRIGEDIENVWQTIGFGLRLFVENIVYFVVSTVILFCLNWKLALCCFAIMIPIGYIAMKLESKFGATYGEISDQTAKINTAAQENIAGVRLVKAFAREKHEILKFLEMNKSYYNMNINQAKTISKYFPPIEFLTNISLVIMIILGGYFVMIGDMTLGVLVAFSGYIWNLIWPMRMLGWLIDVISKNNASAKKIFNILDREQTLDLSMSIKADLDIKGAVEFENVSFNYGDREILKDISMKVKPGNKVAIMGTTGAGKSTLLNLLGRYYDVNSGSVSVDNIDVKEMTLETLRKNISVVPQETFLFSDTILNNLKFGNESVTFEEIEEMCKIACCYDFINELEEGYNTEIGERGIGLSGGQKQRLCIARALIKKSPILILDDATSALDMETEYELLSNLKKQNDLNTIFIVAHRISAVKNCDLIVYLQDGKIIEAGNHEELLALKGEYFNIYQDQFIDFAREEEA